VSEPYDEAYEGDGRPRPHYAEPLASLGDPAALAAEVKRRLRARGLSFRHAERRDFALDPVPRILPEAEWSEVQAGIVQRLRALEAFVADVYGEGRVFDAGVLAREDVEVSPHYEPTMRGASPSRWVSFAGLDVVRAPDGPEWRTRWRLARRFVTCSARRRRSRTCRSYSASSRWPSATPRRREWTSLAS
jgi:uncharacterized circularly permuted ATP-grasp superfamily protein